MSWEDKADRIFDMLGDFKEALGELRKRVAEHHDELTKFRYRIEAIESGIGKLVEQQEERDRESRRSWRDLIFKVLAALSIATVGALLGKSL